MKKILSYQTKLQNCDGGCNLDESKRHKREIPRIIEDKKGLDLFLNEIKKFNDDGKNLDLELKYSCEYLIYDYYIAFLVEISKFENIKNIYLQTNGSTSLFLSYEIDFSKLKINIDYSKDDCLMDDLKNTIMGFEKNNIDYKLIVHKQDLDELYEDKDIKAFLKEEKIQLKKENCLL